MVFPEYRPRRMRLNENLRAMIRETRLAPEQMIFPLFIMPGKGKREEIPSMPGIFRISVDQLGREAEDCLAADRWVHLFDPASQNQSGAPCPVHRMAHRCAADQVHPPGHPALSVQRIWRRPVRWYPHHHLLRDPGEIQESGVPGRG